MAYLILAVAVMFAVANNYFLRRFNNREIDNTGDSLIFNAAISMVWVCVIFFWNCISNGKFMLPSYTAAFYGVIYGLNLSMFLLFKCQSIVSGPVSLSSLIGACGFIIATIFSTIYNQEKMSGIQVIGMAMMVASIYMCISPKKNTMVLTTKWKIFALLFFCTGGIIGVINKLFQLSSAQAEIDAMMFVASITAVITLIVIGFTANKITKKPAPHISKRNIGYVLLCGFVSCVYNRMNVYLAGVLPGVILFPISNGCLIFASTILGVLVFGERLSIIQKLGIIVGFISIILIGCF